MPTLQIWIGPRPNGNVPLPREVRPGDVLRLVEYDFWRKPYRGGDRGGPHDFQVAFYDPRFGFWWRLVQVLTFFDLPACPDHPHARTFYAHDCDPLIVDGGFECIYRLDVPRKLLAQVHAKVFAPAEEG